MNNKLPKSHQLLTFMWFHDMLFLRGKQEDKRLRISSQWKRMHSKKCWVMFLN